MCCGFKRSGTGSPWGRRRVCEEHLKHSPLSHITRSLFSFLFLNNCDFNLVFFLFTLTFSHISGRLFSLDSVFGLYQLQGETLEIMSHENTWWSRTERREKPTFSVFRAKDTR